MSFLKRLLLALVILVGGGIIYYVNVADHSSAEMLSQPLPIIDRGNNVEKTYVQPKWMIPDLAVQAKSVLLMDEQTGRILYEHNMDVPLPAASMSKIMTELLVLEAVDAGKLTWDQKVIPSDYVMAVSNTPGVASINLDAEKSYTIRELFNAMAIHSANDAAVALSEAVAGSEKEFAVMMNKKAKKLGLDQSSFVNSSGLNNKDLGEYYSTGLPDASNILSARDLAKLAQYLIVHYPDILDIVSQSTLTFDETIYTNTNMMLRKSVNESLAFEGVDGLKTGYTSEAGYCFVGTVERSGTRLISVVMGTNSIHDRFLQTKNMYEAAFQYIEAS